MPASLLHSAILALSAIAPAKQEAPWAIGMEQLYRLDLLPAFKRSIKIGAVTSYDRTGGNDDGFSGKYSFVAKEGEHLVLADLKGPGCIYRIHTPTPTNDPLEFYFDGEATPRVSIPFRELFTGKTSPFLRPVVDYAGGGYTSYLPMPFKKSCKVILRGKHLQFYDLNYALYPADAPVTTFDPKNTAGLEQAKAVFGYETDLTKFNTPSSNPAKATSFETSLKPGTTATIFQSKRGGRIAGIKLGPAESFAGKDRDILLKVTWDDDKQPAVLAPVADFFGYAWGQPASRSRFIGTWEGENYCYFPMPFDKAAKIELVSMRDTAVNVRGSVMVSDAARKPYEGKFYAVWRRENPTTKGKPFTWLDTTGRGHIVGLSIQAQGMEPASTVFFEGDDNTTVDGELVVHGTGSEDFFNGGWYDVPDRWDNPVARALSGCMTYQKHLGRTGAYRFFLGDAYPYRKSILQTIEHGPERNETPTDYAGMTYLYSESRPNADFSVPSLARRRVIDPEKIAFAAHWTLPISSFSFADATLRRGDVPNGNGNTRVLSIRNKGADFFGPPFISFICELPATGKYKVYADVVKSPDVGIVQLLRDETPMGDPVDLYSEKPAVANNLYFGEISAVQGNNRVMLKLVGKNEDSEGLGLELVNLVFVRS